MKFPYIIRFEANLKKAWKAVLRKYAILLNSVNSKIRNGNLFLYGILNFWKLKATIRQILW